MRSRRANPGLLAALLLAAALAPRAVASAAFSLQLEPAVIGMGAFYGGAPLQALGRAEAGADVVVAVRGAAQGETYGRKRKFGPIWITSGKVSVDNVPSLWLVASARDVSKILHRDVIQRLQLDRAALRDALRVEPDSPERRQIAADYLALKFQLGVYAAFNGHLKTEPAGNGSYRYRVEMMWPKTAPPGSYQVTAYQCRQGRVIGESSATLQVQRVGFPAWIAEVAETRAALYGLFAILIAAAAGLGMDALVTVLGGKKAKAH